MRMLNDDPPNTLVLRPPRTRWLLGVWRKIRDLPVLPAEPTIYVLADYRASRNPNSRVRHGAKSK